MLPLVGGMFRTIWAALAVFLLFFTGFIFIAVHICVFVLTGLFSRYPYKVSQKFFTSVYSGLNFWIVQKSCPESRIRVCVDKDDLLTMKVLEKGFKFGQRLDEVEAPSDQRYVMMANHQIYLDWLYMWSLASHIGLAGGIRYILKRTLMFVPILGLGMKLMDFIFVSRNWEKDRLKLPRRVKRLAYRDFPFALCIFPEGTTLSKGTFAAMKEHAKEKNISEDQIPKRCLIPRVNGIHTILNGLNEDCDGVLDITIYFQGADFDKEDPEVTFGIKKLLLEGIAPKTIHFHVKFYPLSEIPYENRDEMSAWLKDRFLEKSVRLDEITEKGKFANVKYQWGESSISHDPFSSALLSAALATVIMCLCYVGISNIIGIK